MLALYKNIKERRIQLSMSQQELAEQAGYTDRSSIAKIEAGKVDLTQSKIKAIADALKTTSAELMGELDVGSAVSAFPAPTVTEAVTTFPVIGEIAAGYDNIALENWDGDTVEIPNAYLKGRQQDECFVLSVKGDSMYPDYRDGDKVLILKQSTLNYSGQIGAVLYDDEIATLKMVRYAAGEDWMELVPINPHVPPIKIENERLAHCKVLGIPKLLIREMN